MRRGACWINSAIQPVLMGMPRRQRKLTAPGGMESTLNRPNASASTVITPALCLTSTTADWRGISWPVSRRESAVPDISS
jgi:hypothetical protein